jgi:hypothetical protein
LRYWKEEVIWELNSFMDLIELPFQLLVFGVLNTGLITELHRGGEEGDSEFIARLDHRQYGLRTNISAISPRLASRNRSPVAFTPSQNNFFFNFSALYDTPYYSQAHAVFTPETC